MRFKIDGKVPSFELQCRKKRSEIEINVSKHGKIQSTKQHATSKDNMFYQVANPVIFLGRA